MEGQANQSNLVKNNQEQEQTAYQAIIQALGKLGDFIQKNKTKIGITVSSALAIYLLKDRVYDHIEPISDVFQNIDKKKFANVIIGSWFVLSYYKPEIQGKKSYSISALGQNHDLLQQKLKQNSTTYAYPILNEGALMSILGLIGTGFIYWKMFTFLKDPHQYKAKEKKDIERSQREKTFADVGGCKEAKEALQGIIQYLQHPEQFAQHGVRMPRGVLLYGPPGTGKTLIAKAAAAQAGIPVIYTSGSEFVEVFVGLGAKRVREIFRQAREKSPCMIFIDEIDAVGFSRGNNNYIVGGGHREMETTLNQLLNEMDGFEENDRILVVAATNLNTTLDQALTRPGRFDQKIQVDMPNVDDLIEIYKVHLSNKKQEITEDQLREIAQRSVGLVGADIENLVNLASFQQVRKAVAEKKPATPLTGKELLEQVGVYISEKTKPQQHYNNGGIPQHYYR